MNCTSTTCLEIISKQSPCILKQTLLLVCYRKLIQAKFTIAQKQYKRANSTINYRKLNRVIRQMTYTLSNKDSLCMCKCVLIREILKKQLNRLKKRHAGILQIIKIFSFLIDNRQATRVEYIKFFRDVKKKINHSDQDSDSTLDSDFELDEFLKSDSDDSLDCESVNVESSLRNRVKIDTSSIQNLLKLAKISFQSTLSKSQEPSNTDNEEITTDDFEFESAAFINDFNKLVEKLESPLEILFQIGSKIFESFPKREKKDDLSVHHLICQVKSKLSLQENCNNQIDTN